MHIGFDAKRAFNNHTGLGNYSRFIINALLQYAPAHQYTAYTPKIGRANWHPEKLAIGTPPHKMLGAWWRSVGIKKQLQQDHVQLFHGLSNELPWGIHRTGIKSVVTIHDLIFLRYPSLYPRIDRWIYARKFKQACMQADVVVAISEQTKRDIITFLGIPSEKIVVIYQDADPVFANPLSPATLQQTLQQYRLAKPYMLCVATIAERKNQLLLLQAYEALATQAIDLVLVGGKGSYQEVLQQFIDKHQLKGVHIFNKVPFKDLPALYQGASLTVYPSVFEGFGIPIVESLHSGVPVIAAQGSCLEEAGGKGALYCSPTDALDLAEKIQQVWQNKALAQEMVMAGKQHIQQFSAATIAHQLHQLYTAI